MREKRKVLITCKTYPQPSLTYREVVCTAGVFEDGSLVRLYPVDYRYLEQESKFAKYDLIEVLLEKNQDDIRPESYRPNLQSVKLLDHLDTKHNWKSRKSYVLAKGTQIMCDLEETKQKDVSLGIVKPVGQVRVVVEEETDREWSSEKSQILRQMNFFQEDGKPLEKIPYKFYCVFKCENPDCKGHRKSIIDWEIMQLYRKVNNKYKSESRAIEEVRRKIEDDICKPQNDVHFFVGTVLKHGSWLIIGLFYPKRNSQMELF